MPLTTLDICIRRLSDASLAADVTLTSAASAAPSQLARDVPVALDAAELLGISGDPAAYGAALSAQLFADQALRDAWLKARAYAAIGDLQLRLRLDSRADDLHALRWETLRDPDSCQPIALYERVRLARALDTPDLTPVTIPPRPDLRALVVVSNPSDLGTFNLAEVDVDGEVARARDALGGIPTAILGDHADAAGRATRANLADQLRNTPPIVLLVAHGTLRDGQTRLWLEREDGAADQVASTDIVAAIERLSSRPLLLVLVSCRSAGAGYSDTLSALGPGLARAGVPAVLGFQGDVAMSTVKMLLPSLISELRRDGQIDRALAAARAALGEAQPWWQAVLWLRTDGRIWVEPQPRRVPRWLLSTAAAILTLIATGLVAVLFVGARQAQAAAVDLVWINQARVAFEKVEVSNARYRLCTEMPWTGCNAPQPSSGYGQADTETYPVAGVGYADAVQFCQWLGRRLPTFEEWHAAVFLRADGTARDSPELAKLFANAIFAPGRTIEQNGATYPLPVPVGESQSILAADQPVFDMVGSVWEWTSTTCTLSDDCAASGPRMKVAGGSFVDGLNLFEIAQDQTQLDSLVVDERRADAPAKTTGFRCVAERTN